MNKHIESLLISFFKLFILTQVHNNNNNNKRPYQGMHKMLVKVKDSYMYKPERSNAGSPCMHVHNEPPIVCNSVTIGLKLMRVKNGSEPTGFHWKNRYFNTIVSPPPRTG